MVIHIPIALFGISTVVVMGMFAFYVLPQIVSILKFFENGLVITIIFIIVAYIVLIKLNIIEGISIKKVVK